MNRHSPAHSAAPATLATCLRQVYLLERDTGQLCRILGLYAARGLDITETDYAYAAQHVMRLNVGVNGDSAELADTLRVLVEKAASLVGVLAASELEPQQRRAA